MLVLPQSLNKRRHGINDVTNAVTSTNGVMKSVGRLARKSKGRAKPLRASQCSVPPEMTFLGAAADPVEVVLSTGLRLTLVQWISPQAPENQLPNSKHARVEFTCLRLFSP